MSDAQIVRLVEEIEAERRNKWRISKRKQRSCPQDNAESEDKERKGSTPPKERNLVRERLRNLSLTSSDGKDFEDFWQAYPKRDGNNPRKTALQAFKKAVANGSDPAVIIAGAKRYADSEGKRGKIGTPYIPMAATWLNQERWNDEATRAAEPDDGSWRLEIAKNLAEIRRKNLEQRAAADASGSGVSHAGSRPHSETKPANGQGNSGGHKPSNDAGPMVSLGKILSRSSGVLSVDNAADAGQRDDGSDRAPRTIRSDV